MQVQGWLIFVPETLSIAFLPKRKECIGGELLDWQSLTMGQNLQQFISDFNPKLESLSDYHCYFIDEDGSKLENWFANVSSAVASGV